MLTHIGLTMLIIAGVLQVPHISEKEALKLGIVAAVFGIIFIILGVVLS